MKNKFSIFVCFSLIFHTYSWVLQRVIEKWRRSGIFIVNSEHISHLVLVFLLLTLNM